MDPVLLHSKAQDSTLAHYFRLRVAFLSLLIFASIILVLASNGRVIVLKIPPRALSLRISGSIFIEALWTSPVPVHRVEDASQCLRFLWTGAAALCLSHNIAELWKFIQVGLSLLGASFASRERSNEPECWLLFGCSPFVFVVRIFKVAIEIAVMMRIATRKKE